MKNNLIFAFMTLFAVYCCAAVASTGHYGAGVAVGAPTQVSQGQNYATIAGAGYSDPAPTSVTDVCIVGAVHGYYHVTPTVPPRGSLQRFSQLCQ